MPDPRKTWKPGDPPLPRWKVVYSPDKDISVSREFLRTRDGNKSPSEGESVGIVVDSRHRHRGLVPDGEKASYKERKYRIVGVEHEGTSRERYHLKAEE